MVTYSNKILFHGLTSGDSMEYFQNVHRSHKKMMLTTSQPGNL